MKLSLRKTKAYVIQNGELQEDDRRLVVWWYGPLTKNRCAGSIPNIVVFFRTLLEDGTWSSTLIRRDVALTHLGLLRLGSVWRGGICDSRIKRPGQRFRVSFDAGHWRIISPYEAVREYGEVNPIPEADYKTDYGSDKNYLLELGLPQGKRLLIPCTEFFVRFYGRSAEVKRVLATYPWEEAESKLYRPLEEDAAPPGTWPIKLAKRMYNNDAVFLAHVKHDPYAQHAARSIYSQAEAAFLNNNRYVFLKVQPWFQGAAQLDVEVVPLEDGRSFLGLRILGGSEPQGDAVFRDRENTNRVDATEADGTVGGLPGNRPARPSTLPDIVNLTEDEEPDHGTASLEIEDDDFVVIGKRRTVIDGNRAKSLGGTRRLRDGGCTGGLSTGEPYGGGKGVGHASIHAPVVLESHGVLRDMWNAAQRLHKKRPQEIQAVHWFTWEAGFSSDAEPQLIALHPFPAQEKSISKSKRNWVFLDHDTQTPRGVLVIRLQIALQHVYLFEIQRKPAKMNSDGETESGAGKGFKGLVCTLHDQAKFESWLREFLDRVRKVEGVVKDLVALCPGTADTYKHVAAEGEEGSCDAALKNALRKINVHSTLEKIDIAHRLAP